MTLDINEKRKRFEQEAVVHSDGLYRTALRMTRNTDDAADLVQEAMVKAYRFWDKYEEGSNARAWLYKIMTNIFINNYRSKTRAPQMVAYEDIDDNFLYGQLADLDPKTNPEQEFFAKVFDDDVKKAIEELPEDFRLVVVLSFLEGFSYQEIANIAGLNIGTVKSRLHRGRKLLQKSLWDYAKRSGFLSEAQDKSPGDSSSAPTKTDKPAGSSGALIPDKSGQSAQSEDKSDQLGDSPDSG